MGSNPTLSASILVAAVGVGEEDALVIHAPLCDVVRHSDGDGASESGHILIEWPAAKISHFVPCLSVPEVPKLETFNEYSAVNPDSMSATTCASAPAPAPNGGSQELLAASFNWGTTADNSNLLGLNTTANSSRLSTPVSVAQTYGYDNVNRLTSASETAAGSTSWSRSFGYDAYGNIWVTANTGVSLNGLAPTSNVYSNNQMSTNTYDASGNVTASGSSNSTALYYDAENHQIQATEPASLGGGTEYYYYDGNGLRVEKSGPAGTSVFAYDASGKPAYEYDTAANTPPCTTCYLSPDHLGTPRMVTDASANVIGWHDYLPFGEEIPNGIGGRTNFWGAATDNIKQKFTGKERDAETGNDYFGARYYASSMGRWLSPDWSVKVEPVPYAKLDDPQSLNLYSYVRNNPLSRNDPDGHEVDFDQNAKKGEKLLLDNVSKSERKMFEVTKNGDGKSVLGLKDGAEDKFKGNHTEGYNRLTTAINSDKVETINVAKTYTDSQGVSHNVSREDGGGVTLMYGNGSSTIYVSPSGNPGQLTGVSGKAISDPLGIIMGHETLGHGLENAIGGDTSQHRAIEIENQLRHEQRQPERAQDPQ